MPLLDSAAKGNVLFGNLSEIDSFQNVFGGAIFKTIYIAGHSVTNNVKINLNALIFER